MPLLKMDVEMGWFIARLLIGEFADSNSAASAISQDSTIGSATPL